MEQNFKRNVANKLRIGELLTGKPILENEKLKALEIDSKQVVRVNIIANIIDKFIQDNEKKYATITIDDATGQIRVKSFGDDVDKMANFSQGDTILVVGLVRSWNNEVYITPEIIKKKDPSYLMLRKLEIESSKPKSLDKPQLAALKDKIIDMIKEAEKNQGIEEEKIVLDLHEPPEIIRQEVKRLLEDGLIYEPRPGKLRWLG